MVRRSATVLAYLSLIIAGFLVGVAGSFVQAVSVRLGPLTVPLGLAGMLAATGSVFFAGAWLTSRPIGVLLPALAWMIGVFPFTLERPEGDLVLGSDLRSYGFVLLGAALAVAAALYPGRDTTVRPPDHSGESADLGPLFPSRTAAQVTTRLEQNGSRWRPIPWRSWRLRAREIAIPSSDREVDQ